MEQIVLEYLKSFNCLIQVCKQINSDSFKDKVANKQPFT